MQTKTGLLLLASCVVWSASALHADDELLKLLQEQQSQIHELQERLGEHDRMLQRLPNVEQSAFDYASYNNDQHVAGACDCPTHYVGYDKGFFVRPYCPADTPFELKVNGRIQMRHTAFERHAAGYFNRATGTTVPITERNDIEIERSRLTFSGFVHDPGLQYYINLDMDTDDSHRVIAHDFWFNYKFSEAFNLYAGKAFVPGSQDWLDGALKLRFGDRPMATTFFRPDRSVGLWAIGKLKHDLTYRVMLGNGYQTTDLRPAQVDNRLMVAGSAKWNAIGDYGSGRSDLEWHEQPAVRMSGSFVFASNEGSITGAPLAEQAFVRLSDGVRLTDAGALAAGVTVNHFDVWLVAAHLAGKYRGFSFDGEYFARWVDNFRATGPIPHNELYTDGFYFDIGYMLCPGAWEIMGRMSTVDGLFGDAWEYAAGINYFINGHNNKLTFDVTYLDGSPANNSGANYRLGDRGIMYRTGWQVAF